MQTALLREPHDQAAREMYLTVLANSGAPEDTRRLACMIWHNLDTLADLGATWHARSTRLALWRPTGKAL